MKEQLQGAMKTTGKWAKRAMWILLVLGLAVFAFFYFGSYSDGYRSGKVMKVSKKGYIFKTYEGQLNIEGFGAVRGENSFSQTFEFSVEKDRHEVIEALEDAALKGSHVSLHYQEKYFTFFWKGETKYFVDEVKFSADTPEEPAGAPFE